LQGVVALLYLHGDFRDISGLVYSRMSFKSLRSLAACKRMKVVLRCAKKFLPENLPG